MPLPHSESTGSINLFRHQGQAEKWKSDSGTNGLAPRAPGLPPGLWTHFMGGCPSPSGVLLLAQTSEQDDSSYPTPQDVN